MTFAAHAAVTTNLLIHFDGSMAGNSYTLGAEEIDTTGTFGGNGAPSVSGGEADLAGGSDGFQIDPTSLGTLTGIDWVAEAIVSFDSLGSLSTVIDVQGDVDFRINFDANALEAAYWDGGSLGTQTAPLPAAGTPVHLALVWSAAASSLTAYVDGTSIGSVDNNTFATPDTGNLSFGYFGRSGHDNRGIDGQLDAVSFATSTGPILPEDFLLLPESSAFVLANGDFESQSGSGEVLDVDGWFESTTGDYNDWVNIDPNNASHYPAGQGNIFNMSAESGYIYQSLGLRTNYDNGLRVSGNAILRYPGGSREFRPFRISVYETAAEVTGADGTHPVDLSGANLLDTKVFTSALLGFSATPSGPELQPFTVDLTLGNATTGSMLWLVFDAESGMGEVGLDDLDVTALDVDPGGSTPSVPKIMFLGDSFWQRDEMRQMIYNGLSSAGEVFDFVGSEGRGTGPAGLFSSVTDPDHESVASKQVIHAINGRTDTPSRYNSPILTVLADHDPDIVAIELGVNDTWYNFQAASPPYVQNEGRTPDQLIGDVWQLARMIHQYDATIRMIISTVTPITVPNPYIGYEATNYNAQVLVYNQKLSAAVSEMAGAGIHITLNDNHGAWAGDATGLVGDGLHPNTAGNQLLADAWVASIRDTMVAFDGGIHYDTVQLIDASDTDEEKVEKAAKLLPRSKQVDWQRLETTFFIHFGPNTFNGVELGNGFESVNDFNPTAFDAAQWVDVIKQAGGKMVMLVVKHHEGFCLFPSRYTTHDVASSSWLGGSGDVVRAVSDACAAQGLQFGIYLSPADSYQIESSTSYTEGSGYYGHGSATLASIIPTDPATFGSSPLQGRTPPAGFTSYQYDADDYNRYFLNQLYELLTEYGDIAEVWFDGATPKSGPYPQDYNLHDWYDLINKLQPNANIAVKGPDIRWVGNELGTARETEWSPIPIPESPATYSWNDATATDLGSRAMLTGGSYLVWWPAEAYVPILNKWFWKESNSVKSAQNIIHIYHHSVGRNANLLLNLSPDTRGLIPDNQIVPVLEAFSVIQQTYGTDLAAGGSMTSDSTRSGQPASNILDGDLDTYWEADSGDSTAMLILTLPSAQTIDRIALQEAIAMRGMRIESFAIDTWNGVSWDQQATSTCVGHKRIVEIPETTTDQVRIRITQSRLEPTLANISLHKSAKVVDRPSIGNRNASGQVAVTNDNGNAIYYTVDGSTPTTLSTLYTGPVDLPLGGTIKAISHDGSSESFVVSKEFAGMTPTGWKVISVDSEEVPGNDADLAIDDNPDTYWHAAVTGSGPHPHHITVDMGSNQWIGGFSYLPRNDGENGIVKAYRFEVSEDNVSWTTAAEGEFVNMKNSPVLQKVFFPGPVKVRYFRFSSISEINGADYASAAEINVLPGGFDRYRQALGLQTALPLDDDDGDDTVLLLEYYLGTDPFAADARPLVFASQAGDFLLEVLRNENIDDITTSVRYSLDLTSSNWFEATINGMASTNLGDGLVQDRYRIVLPAGSQVFFRLTISR